MSGRQEEKQDGGNSRMQWVDEKAAALMTGLSVHTLRAHRQRRKGPPYSKVGRSVRYCTADVQLFMASARIDPAN